MPSHQLVQFLKYQVAVATVRLIRPGFWQLFRRYKVRTVTGLKVINFQSTQNVFEGVHASIIGNALSLSLPQGSCSTQNQGGCRPKISREFAALPKFNSGM